MAKKSAFIDAALSVGSLSGYFTQDLDEAPEQDEKPKQQTKSGTKKPDYAKDVIERLGKLDETAFGTVIDYLIEKGSLSDSEPHEEAIPKMEPKLLKYWAENFEKVQNNAADWVINKPKEVENDIPY